MATFRVKSPLAPGKQPSDAVDAIFAPTAGTMLGCLGMTRAVEYYSMLKGLGAPQFNARFPAGVGIEVSSDKTSPLTEGPNKKYKIVTVTSENQLLPGDWVYFQNLKDYAVRFPRGFWLGENAIYLGFGRYDGFGVHKGKERDVNLQLVGDYNDATGSHKTVEDLIAEGGGRQPSPVIRRDISTVMP